MASLLENKLVAEASSFGGETSGDVALKGDSRVLGAAELQNVQAGGRRRRRRSSSKKGVKRVAKRSAKRSRGSRRRSLRSLFSF